MKSRFIQRLVLCLLALCLPTLCLPTSASDKCVAGSGGTAYSLGEGQTLQLNGGFGDHAGQCHVAISNGSGPVFETYAYDLQLDEFSGRDVNNDGKPDVILFGHVTGPKDRLTYWIVSLAAPAGLARQITTVYPLSFEDRDGDGKLEIWTREWSYNGIDGLDASDSPHPLVAFRLVGNRLIWVSDRFATEYDTEIAQARQQISADGVSKLRNEEPTSVMVQKEKAGASDKADPKLDARAYEAKLGILQVVTSYLYMGKGAEAWKELSDWPYNDRDRIRTLLVRGRMNGMIKQLNAPQPGAPKETAAQPPAATNPQ
ncbi:MAG: hypothetical protein M3P27_02795 [Acidobacteriota bacterium]|nr:hypothetical protein [Acidobacteriota bacterium]